MGIEHLIGRSSFKEPLLELRILCVSQIVFPWSLVPRWQLKVTLNNKVLISEPGVSPHDDLSQLVDLLVNWPALEAPTLKNCLPATVSESSGRQRIHLPRLSCLCLTGSCSRVTNLFKMPKLSSSTTLRLNMKPADVATLNEHPILPVLSAHFNGPTPSQRGKGHKRRRGDNGRGTRRQAANNNNDNDSVSAPVLVPIFPKLTSLLLEMLYFNDVVPGSGALHDLVLSAVKRRKAKKTPLSTLCIAHCVIRAEKAAAFEKVVRDFRWDRDYGKCDDDVDDEDDEDRDDYHYDNYHHDYHHSDISDPGLL